MSKQFKIFCVIMIPIMFYFFFCKNEHKPGPTAMANESQAFAIRKAKPYIIKTQSNPLEKTGNRSAAVFDSPIIKNSLDAIPMPQISSMNVIGGKPIGGGVKFEKIKVVGILYSDNPSAILKIKDEYITVIPGYQKKEMSVDRIDNNGVLISYSGSEAKFIKIGDN